MKNGDSITFVWRPPEPLDGFECALALDATSLPSKALAVVARVTDADGDEIAPTASFWFYSDRLHAHFTYTPASTGDGVARLAGWQGDAILDEIRIEVVGWALPEDTDVRVRGLAISPFPSDPTAHRTWTLLRSTREDTA